MHELDPAYAEAASQAGATEVPRPQACGSVQQPIAHILQLQRSVGNAAVANMLARRPSPTVPVLGAPAEPLVARQALPGGGRGRFAAGTGDARYVRSLARQETGQFNLPPLSGRGVLDPSVPLPSVQLTSPSLLRPPAQPGFSPGEWRLLPELQLRLRPLDDALQPDRIRELLRQVQLPASALPNPSAPQLSFPPPAPAPPLRPPGPFDVSPTEPATPGDLLTALASVPEIDRLSAQAREQLWTQLPTARTSALTISGVVIGASALTGALASPSGRQALAALGGRPLSFPGVPWFQPEFNVEGANVLVGLHIDVGAFLGGRGGFGTADRGPTPLTPHSP
jgi:hypothetical protein